jgi:thymidylate synthase ThyX
MKITVNVDCTPEEARAFLGLPDVRPMQEELMREMQERMSASLRAMEPEEMMRLWLPGAMKGVEQWQELLRQMTGGKRD